ncbi:protein shortage in chiasmata 1 ortholog isoform X3 [Hyla sarda]|uniref:protein shortage in chiasmata 1 ortholog isoform X3 n=1 Tax=Hyla sarda TaxID=327740 RepID=UPI0024C2ABF0|nr:protein shortage in chiasmata 1 ortholog isoform X3 [Hyla sarda]
MNSFLFPVFRFLSLDYEYENFMKHKLATSRMLISFPKEILQEEQYYHSNIFVNDIYRRPWKRSVPICKVDEEESVAEVCKRFVSFTDFLEKQYTLNKEKSLDIVPSSNPCSQIDLEEVYSGPELYVPEDKHNYEESWKTILSNTLEDYLLPEEIVFVDHLAEFGSHIPRTRSLPSRLKTVPIQDPLVDWQRNVPADKSLFRMNTSIEKNLEPNMFLEEFHMLPQSTEELCLSQPCILELNKNSTQCRSSLSELITIQQLSPEEMLEENGITNIAALSTKMNSKGDFIEQITVERNLNLCKEEHEEKNVCFRSYHDYELEIPITPPCSKPKDAINKNCVNLIEEESSPSSIGFHITDADKDILESQGSNSAVKPLLLKVPFIKEKSEHLSIEEVKGRLSINPDTSVLVTLEEDWRKLRSNTKDPCIIEKLRMNISSTTNLIPNENESFIKLNGVLEEKDSPIKQKTSVYKWKQQSSSNDFSVSMLHSSSSQNNVTCMDTSNNADITTDNMKVDTHGDNADKAKECLPLTQDKKQYPTPVKEILSVSYVSQASSSQQQSKKIVDGGLSGHDNQEKEDCDLLSSFIALRTKSSIGHSECKHEEKVLSQANDAQKRRSTTKENAMFRNIISKSMPEEFPKQQMITVHVALSGSQRQAYHVLQAAAKPVLNKLVCLEVVECMNWNFASVPFDCTRFLLRKQEKISSESGKLEYLCKAKQEYKSVLGPYLDDVWRKLRVVQFVRDKAEEPDPKITALLKWMEKANKKSEHYKVLILTQMNAKTIEETLNNIYIKAGGFRATGLYPANGNTFVETKDVLDSLKSYSCVIVNNQYVGNDFPWTYFSLVIEYDCTNYWLQLCQKLNISHMNLKTSAPNNLLLETPKHNHQGGIHIPYVLLSSELFNHSELLHILESRHNITFIERSCNTSVHLFGNKNHCAIITVDVSTAIIIQDLEEIMCKISAETLILKLVALSLQYSCCWVLLYDKKSNQSEYSLSADILHGVCLTYAAVIILTKKSEDVDIKVLISSGIDKTGSLIHQIVDYTLKTCKSDPYKWLDRSWLSVHMSKEEKVLLSFPCNNPMVSRLLLCRGSSLQWLLSATMDQLKELFPEVPSKVLKHFSDITAIHQLSLAASPRPSQPPTSMEPTAAIQAPSTNIHNQCVSNKYLQSETLQSKSNTTKYNKTSSSLLSQRIQNKDDASTSSIHTVECYRRSTMSDSLVMFGQNVSMETNFGTLPQDNSVVGPFSSGQHKILHRVSYHPNAKQAPSFSINRESFYADLSSEWNSANSSYCENEIRDAIAISQPLPSEIQRSLLKQTQGTFHNHLVTVNNNEESYCSKKGIVGKRRLTVNSVLTKEKLSAETSITAQSQQKRTKLTYERVPGRCDGQTRLKFF